MKKSILIYLDWKPLIQSLPDDLRLKFYDLIINFSGQSYNPAIDHPHLRGVFDFIIEKIKANELAYSDKCEQMKANASKRRPKQAEAIKRKQIAGDKEKDNDTVNETDTVTENETDTEHVFKEKKINGDLGKKENASEILEITIKTADEVKFEEFRKNFPGAKLGFEKEWLNFKRHKDWNIALYELLPALDREVRWREDKLTAGQFCPEMKHLKTWINNRCWEQVLPEVISHQAPSKSIYAHNDQVLKEYLENLANREYF